MINKNKLKENNRGVKMPKKKIKALSLTEI